MKKKILQLIMAMLLMLPGLAIAQTPYVAIHDVTTNPGTDIPVQVDMINFTGTTYGNVAAITLTIEFDEALLDFKGLANKQLVGNYYANVDVATPGKLVIIYNATPTGTGYDINGKLFDLLFDYTGGFSSPLIFVDENCEVGNNFLVPIPNVSYTDGSITQTTPVGTVTAGTISAPPGNAVVPVTIGGAGFGAITEIQLNISYDASKFTFVSLGNTPLEGYTLVTSTSGLLDFDWSGSAKNFSATSQLFDLTFSYTGEGNANVNFEHGCKISKEEFLETIPLSTSYVDGGVTLAGASLTIGNVSQSVGAAVNLPITAAAFGTASVGDIELKIGYNSSKLIYNSYVANQLTGWTLNNSTPGQLIFNRAGASATIADGALLTINWSPAGGAGGVTPVVFNSVSQILTPELATIAVDYVDGSIDQATPLMSATIGTMVGCDAVSTLPMTVANLPANVASFTFLLNYDLEILTYTALSDVSTALTDHGAISAGLDASTLVIHWERTPGYTGPITLTGKLFDMLFNHLGASTNVSFITGSVVSDILLNELDVTYTNGAVDCDYRTLNLKVFLEGLYTGGGLMREAQDDFGAHFGSGIADQITVELHNSTTYGTVVYSASNVELNTSGEAVLSISSIYSGSYYITIKHRNSIETTTSLPVSFTGGTINYDFTTAASQAYGDNQIAVGGIFAIFGGDVNQDGLVDSGDLIPVGNEAALASTGYLPEDVTGDGLVDLVDLLVVGNNAAFAIGIAIP